MPREHFDYLMTRELEADNLTKYIANPDNKLAEPSAPWVWFLTFFLLGAGTGVIVGK